MAGLRSNTSGQKDWDRCQIVYLNSKCLVAVRDLGRLALLQLVTVDTNVNGTFNKQRNDDNDHHQHHHCRTSSCNNNSSSSSNSKSSNSNSSSGSSNSKSSNSNSKQQ